MLRHLILSLLFVPLLLASQIVCAQRATWNALAQIKTGQKVAVIDRQKNSISGEFVRYSDTDLTLNVKGKEMKIDKNDVTRVTTGPQHRGRNALLGLAAGLALGGVSAACCVEREENYGGAMAGAVVGFAAVGAGIGALIAPKKTFYKAEEPKKAGSKAAGDKLATVRAERAPESVTH